MRFPPQYLDRIRQHFRLSAVIGKRIEIKKKGREYSGLCPFHHEKTPSFTVSDEKGFYHCFGCQAHGDVIGFIKEYEGLGYIQAVEALAREAGLPLPQFTPEMKRQADQAERLYEIMEAAAGWFAAQLRRPPYARALAYLHNRGLQEETLARFRLGYAPPEREALKKALLAKGFSENDIKTAGLLTQPEQGASYDKFRDRVIFPIRDVSGRVIAFGGRLLASLPDAPKYLNSPETPLFHKGRVLYNSDLARKAAARSGKIVIAEGYMDVIALAQAGFGHAVAPLGTAVTEEQLALLWQLADEPVFCLDGDSAGKQAMLRALNLALPHLTPGKSLRFCLLPGGEDPDSLIKTRGQEEMARLLDHATPLIDMLWNAYFAVAPATPEARAAAEEGLYKAVAAIQHPGLQRAYRDDIRKRLFEAGRWQPKTKNTPAAPPRTSLASRLPPQDSLVWQRRALERQMLAVLLYCPALLYEPEVELTLTHLQCAETSLEELRQELMHHAAYSAELIHRDSLLRAFSSEALRQDADKILTAIQNDPAYRELMAVSADAASVAREIFAKASARLEHLALQAEALAESRRCLSGADDAGAERSLHLLREAQEKNRLEYHLGKNNS